ncbi:MAG: tRNA (adenosine(37)-N6)-threonylcarbamoyltransferase complex ATPase subunit type 1 TsaE [bacterium]|nr:tRNA (adenosine(37)-N6)-threonylcarbamoyltransferase complex ATPase subunit type 1 TsaE [bacterium]
MKIYNSNSLEKTQKIAEKFAHSLKKGSIIALYGDLGSGKTTFVQGLAKGLGIKRRIISPTFVLVRQYKIKDQKSKIKTMVRQAHHPEQSRRTDQNSKFFYHIDLYRISNEKEIEGLGIKELMSDPQNIVAIEWAEKMGKLLPQKRIDIYFEYVDKDKRRIKIEDNF